MYPQPERREMGKGAIPSLGKIQKITPEWQTEQLRSVDSVVARVKGKHHDGDVSKLDGVFCRQIRWYREPFRPVWMKGSFFYQHKKRKNRTIIHTKEKQEQNTKEHSILKSINYHFKEEFKCTTKSPIT